MSNTTLKGTVLDFTVGENGWGAAVDNDLLRLDAWSTVFWAFDPINSSALGYHYYGGPILSGGTPTMIANGSIILADNSLNYVERTTAGVVSRNGTGFTAGSIPMAKVTTLATAITVLEDWRSPDIYPPPVGLQARATVTKTTGTLANNTTENSTVQLAKASVLHSIQVDRACRVVLYSTDAARTADSGRPLGTPPTPGLGILAEFAPVGASTIDCGPRVLLGNGDVSPATDIYYAITNLSGSTHTVQVDFLHVKLEA